MTAPAPWRRSTAAERRGWRQEYRELKQRLERERKTSPEHLKSLERWRRMEDRERAQNKFAAALRGVGIKMFTAKEVARITPDEIAKLRKEVANRMQQLTEAARAAFKANSWMCVLSLSLEQLRAIAAGPPP